MVVTNVSDLIKPEELRKWKKGDIITVKAGTGKGKSYFIKNRLYASAKKEGSKILMLIHRKNCVDQFQKEIERDGKTDVIDIRTYQAIEFKNKNGLFYDFSGYEYIVCDEFHYFLGDAGFNRTTDISLSTILEQTDKTKIFMSATGDYMTNYINNFKGLKTINYEMPINYNFIKSLSFFDKDETLERFIEECIKNNDKGIFFIQSATKAYELHKKYKEYSLYNCSESDKHYKYVDEVKKQEMLQNERFEENILFTTTALDAGVNIIDTDLKHIVVDVEDIGSLIQCIGRKRIQNEDDKIHVYIHSINNNKLGGRITQLKKELEMADYCRANTTYDYIQRYGRDLDYSKIVYDATVEEFDKSTKRVNELAYFKAKIDIGHMESMLELGEFSYIKYMSNLLKIDKYRIIDEKYEKETLDKYLDSIVGKELYKSEQSELIEVFKENGLNARTTGINTINGNMKDRKLPYIIDIGKRKSYRDKETNKIKKERSHWVVGKIVY